MTPSERDKGGGQPDPEDLRIRRVLQAAAARPDEVPEPGSFLMSRLRARIAAARRDGTAPQPLAGIGTFAWRVVPALALVFALLAFWTGFETARADRAQDDAASALVEPGDLVPEILDDGAGEPPEERP